MSLTRTTADALLPARRILGGQGCLAYGYRIAVLVLRVPKWTVDMADQLYEECTALTGGANPRTIAHMLRAEPGARVRRRMAELQRALDRRRPSPDQRRVAVIADSAIARGAVTALGWVSDDAVRGFSSREAYQAAEWVAHEHGHAPGILALYEGALELSRR